jgi:hypothetical protein
MKKIIQWLGISFCFSLAITTTHAKELTSPFPHFNYAIGPPVADTSAVLDTMWVSYDITRDTALGMIIHLKFSVSEMKDVDADVAIFFEYDDDRGGRLRDKNKLYSSNGGDVAVYKSINPAYPDAVFEDLQVFMPYNELDLRTGKYDLTIVANLIFPNGDLISHLGKHYFQFTQP